ncbi:CBS domain-containing protein [Variovorax paradoxus]|uniref:CBS domain-containing protein n=1 Tax=Variovorax paradoxus TaxID=34073 RepID=UPI0029C60E33|nr:CBS domain-containing protein [Variovorax paradoxus]
MTQVHEVMTRGVRTVAPGDTIVQAAKALEELEVGVLPVCDGSRLVGVVTDRDIAVRGVAREIDLGASPVKQIMTADAYWCYADDTVDEALSQMSAVQIRRLPVVDRDKRLVGILSLGDVAAKGEAGAAADPLGRISEPARPKHL